MEKIHNNLYIILSPTHFKKAPQNSDFRNEKHLKNTFISDFNAE